MAYLTQSAIFTLALAALLILAVWWACSSNSSSSSQQTAKPMAAEELASLVMAETPSAAVEAASDVQARGVEVAQDEGSTPGAPELELAVAAQPTAAVAVQATTAAAAAGAAAATTEAVPNHSMADAAAIFPPICGQGTKWQSPGKKPPTGWHPPLQPEPGCTVELTSKHANCSDLTLAMMMHPFKSNVPSDVELTESFTSNSVWHLLKQWFMVCECTLSFFAQMLRAVIDVLTPLAMYTTATWVVGMVYLGEAAGAVIAPFVLDALLVKCPGMNLRRAQLLAIIVMSVSAPGVLLCHLSVPGALVMMFCFGAAHSTTEALVFKHLVDHVGSEEPAVLNATMSVFSLFYVLGFTVGAFIAGAPSQEVVWQQQVATAAVAGGMLLYTMVYHWMLSRGFITSVKSHKQH